MATLRLLRPVITEALHLRIPPVACVGSGCLPSTSGRRFMSDKGIVPSGDHDLRPAATDTWKAVTNEENGQIYYWNQRTGMRRTTLSGQVTRWFQSIRGRVNRIIAAKLCLMFVCTSAANISQRFAPRRLDNQGRVPCSA